MKKYLAIVLSVVFVLGLTATAFAIHAEIPAETQAVVAKGATQLTINGSVRVRGEVRNNTGDLDDDAGHSWAWYDERVRLGVDAKVSDNVSGNITLEVADDATHDTYKWGTGGSGATGVYTQGNAKRAGVNLLEGWLMYQGPVGLKVGHMPLALGNKLFFDHTKFGDDAIVVFGNPSPAVHLAGLTIKFNDQSSEANGNSKDADAYVVLATYKGEAISGSADLTWVDDQDFSAGGDANVYNLGVRADGKIGPASIYGDIEYQMGSAEKACVSGTKDCDFKGYAVMLGAKMALGGVNLGLELGQGSGDKDPNDDEIGVFVTSLSSSTPYIGFVYGPRVKTACGTTDTGICNTTYAKLSADGKSGALDYGASLIWLKATEDVVNGAGEKASDLGIEIDATVKYALAKNLNYWIEGGYFMPGDAYKISPTKDADNAYAVRHGIELSF